MYQFLLKGTDSQNEKMSWTLQISMNSQLRACGTSYEKERMISLKPRAQSIKPKPEVKKPQDAKLGLNHHMFPTVKAG